MAWSVGSTTKTYRVVSSLAPARSSAGRNWFQREENTVKYVMLIRDDVDEWDSEQPEVAAGLMKEIFAWFEKWQTAGKIANGGEQLEHPRTARTARRGPDGQPVITDGPFLELKEVVGGFIVLEADDPDDAMAVASTWPGLAYGPGVSVEVRAAVQM
jgi:hypothetical protein